MSTVLIVGATFAAAAGVYYCYKKNRTIGHILDGKHSTRMTMQFEKALLQFQLVSNVDDLLREDEFNRVRTLLERSRLNAVQLSNLVTCMKQIRTARRCIAWLERARSTPYNRENPKHEELLWKMWDMWMGGTRRCERMSSEWSMLGFQGYDPATDFRGGGLLSLCNILCLLDSDHALLNAARTEANPAVAGDKFYLPAVAGINFSVDALNWCKRGGPNRNADFLFYNIDEAELIDISDITSDTVLNNAVLRAFDKLYGKLYAHYHQAWTKDKPHVMSFNQYKKDLFEALPDLYTFLAHTQQQHDEYKPAKTE